MSRVVPARYQRAVPGSQSGGTRGGKTGTGKGPEGMPRSRIPDTIKAQVAERIATFNRAVLRIRTSSTSPATKARSSTIPGAVRRRAEQPHLPVEYTGTLDSWQFAIYKYSDERYDPNEWFFPGAGQVDGTLEGAMRAGLEAYPP